MLFRFSPNVLLGFCIGVVVRKLRVNLPFCYGFFLIRVTLLFYTFLTLTDVFVFWFRFEPSKHLVQRRSSRNVVDVISWHSYVNVSDILVNASRNINLHWMFNEGEDHALAIADRSPLWEIPYRSDVLYCWFPPNSEASEIGFIFF